MIAKAQMHRVHPELSRSALNQLYVVCAQVGLSACPRAALKCSFCNRDVALESDPLLGHDETTVAASRQIAAGSML
jgi:hypothetical protein